VGGLKVTNYYARNPDRPLVYLIGESVINDVKRDETEYISKKLFAFATYQVSKIQLASTEGATRVYEKIKEVNGDVWKQTAPEARDMEGTEVDDLLYKLNGTEAEELATEGPGLTAPRHTITVWSGESENVEELAVGEPTSEAVYAQRNGDELILKLTTSTWEELDALIRFEDAPTEGEQ